MKIRSIKYYVTETNRASNVTRVSYKNKHFQYKNEHIIIVSQLRLI